MRISVNRRLRRRAARLTRVLIAISAAACSGEGSPTQELRGAIGRVDSPNGAEGAAILEFAAPVSEIVVAGGTSHLRTIGSVTRAALVLDRPGIIRFSLPAFESATAPAASVLEVAAGNNAIRPSIATYRVTYER
jgi:hypothetical protein